MLQHASVREALLADEMFGKGNPLSNSLYKLEALMQACAVISSTTFMIAEHIRGPKEQFWGAWPIQPCGLAACSSTRAKRMAHATQ